MSTNNRTCVVCARSYYACKDCEDAAKLGNYRWRNSCDTPECFQVLLIITEFYYDRITKYQAREMLAGIISEKMLPYDSQAKVLIDRIYEDDTILDIVSSNLQDDIAQEQEITEDYSIKNTEISDYPIQEFVVNDEPETVVNEINECYEIDDEV